jgi:general secretion pathway protein I
MRNHEIRKSCRSAFAGAGGFTLLEVMVALVVLAITLLVLLELRNRDIQQNAYSARLTTATLLAQERLTALELSGPLELGETSGTFPGYQEFAWKVRVATTSWEFVREVTLSVFWNPAGPEEQVALTTYQFDAR